MVRITHAELVEQLCKSITKDKKTVGYYKEYPLFHGGNPSRIDLLQGHKTETGVNYIIYEAKTIMMDSTIERCIYQVNKYCNYLAQLKQQIFPPYEVELIMGFLVTLEFASFIDKIVRFRKSLEGSKIAGIFLYDFREKVFRDMNIFSGLKPDCGSHRMGRKIA